MSAGATTAIDLAAAIQAKALARAYPDLAVSYSYSIKLGFNDTLRVSVGGTWYTAAIEAGDYLTPDELAVAVEWSLNAAGTGLTWACTYSCATGKFAVTATGGTFFIQPTVATDPGWFALGFNADTTADTSATANAARWLGVFSFLSKSGTVKLLFGTGANLATSCRTLLGYVEADTTAAASSCGTMMRGNRESLAATSANYWNEKDEQVISADFIRQQIVATLYRDRRFDLVSQPRVTVSFSTLKCPDLQRGRVFRFGPDLDGTYSYSGPGRGGSWYGRRFRVLEVSQNLISSWHQEVVAVEVSPTGKFGSGWGYNWGMDWGG